MFYIIETADETVVGQEILHCILFYITQTAAETVAGQAGAVKREMDVFQQQLNDATLLASRKEYLSRLQGL